VQRMDGRVHSGDDDDDDDFDEHEKRHVEEYGGTQTASRSISTNEIICAMNPNLHKVHHCSTLNMR